MIMQPPSPRHCEPKAKQSRSAEHGAPGLLRRFAPRDDDRAQMTDIPAQSTSEPLPQAPRDLAAAVAAGAAGARHAAADRLALDLDHADRRQPRDGDDDLHHGLGADAGVRADGRAEFRPRRLHRGRRLCRDAGAAAAGLDGAGGFDLDQSRGAGAGGAGRDGGVRRARPRGRAGADPAGLRPAPEADPDDHRRTDRRRAGAVRAVGAGDHSAAAADRAARLLHLRRRRHRQIPAAGDGGRARGVRRHPDWC